MKNYIEINKETYNLVSKNWDEKRKYFWKPVINFLESFKNKENLILLDLGCGTGRHLELALKIGFKKENIIGSDFSFGQIDIVKEKGFQTKISNLTDLEFRNEEFDVIICIAAHHHLLEKEEQLKSLKEMRRVLKPNGQILLCNWMPEKKFIAEQIKKKKFEFLNKENKKVKVTYTFENKKLDRYYYLFEEDELKTLCKEAEFKIINTQIFNGNIYLTLN